MKNILRAAAPGWRPFLAVPVLAVLSAVGCGSGKGTVTGQVQYEGRLLPSGQISFLGQTGEKQVVNGGIVNGMYTVAGVPTGPVKITVRTLPPAVGGVPPHGAPPIQPSGTTLPQTSGEYIPIPPRYADPNQSSLSYQVKWGRQTHNIDLMA